MPDPSVHVRLWQLQILCRHTTIAIGGAGKRRCAEVPLECRVSIETSHALHVLSHTLECWVSIEASIGLHVLTKEHTQANSANLGSPK